MIEKDLNKKRYAAALNERLDIDISDDSDEDATGMLRDKLDADQRKKEEEEEKRAQSLGKLDYDFSLSDKNISIKLPLILNS